MIKIKWRISILKYYKKDSKTNSMSYSKKRKTDQNHILIKCLQVLALKNYECLANSPWPIGPTYSNRIKL